VRDDDEEEEETEPPPRPERSFGPGAERRLARAVIDASGVGRATSTGSLRAAMLDGLRTAAAGLAAALVNVRGTGGRTERLTAAARRRKTTTALLMACGGVEQALRTVVPARRRAPRAVPGPPPAVRGKRKAC